MSELINYRGFVIEIEANETGPYPYSACYLIPMPDGEDCSCCHNGASYSEVQDRAEASIKDFLETTVGDDGTPVLINACESCGIPVHAYETADPGYAAFAKDPEEPTMVCLCQWCEEHLPKHPAEEWPIIGQVTAHSLTCALCEKVVPNVDAAMQAGWQPYFWFVNTEGKDEYRDWACSKCDDEYLELDLNTSEYVLKPAFRCLLETKE